MGQFKRGTKENTASKKVVNISHQRKSLHKTEKSKVKQSTKEPDTFMRKTVNPVIVALKRCGNANKPEQEIIEIKSSEENDDEALDSAYEDDGNLGDLEDMIEHETDEDEDLTLRRDEEKSNLPPTKNNFNIDELYIWEHVRQMRTEDLQVYAFMYLSDKKKSENRAKLNNAARTIKEIFSTSRIYSNNGAILKASLKDDVNRVLKSKDVHCSDTNVILHTWLYYKNIHEALEGNPKKSYHFSIVKVKEGLLKEVKFLGGRRTTW